MSGPDIVASEHRNNLKGGNTKIKMMVIKLLT